MIYCNVCASSNRDENESAEQLNKQELLDIDAVRQEIRSRVQRKQPISSASSVLMSQSGRAAAKDDFTPLRLPAADTFSEQIAGELLIGKMPPTPPTLRGRLGRVLVESVRRSIFWLIPQLQSFQRVVAAVATEQTAALRELAKRSARIHSDQQAMQSDLEDHIEGLRQLLQQVCMQIQQELEPLQEFRQQNENAVASIEPLTNRIRNLEENRVTFEQLTRSVDAKLRQLEQYSHFTRAYLHVQQQQIGRRLDASSTVHAAPPDTLGEASYVEFEESFRGDYADIKNRLLVYLPYLKEVKDKALKGAAAAMLDIGSGRGEWLSILQDNDIAGYGIDSNPGMVQASLGRGFFVQQVDGLVHLRSLPENSLSGVTAFHVIEHLPPAVLESLLDEILRVLKPEGIAILETPDPRNVFVGSRTFYLDPTHRKPLPSELTEFLLRRRGFIDLEVIRLHPYPEEAMLRLPGNRVAEFLDEYFFGPQDYAVICRKPAEANQ